MVVAGAARGESSPPTAGGTFVDVLPSDPGNLDPQMSVFSSTLNASAFAYDTLLYQAVDGEVTSGLAESWEETATSVTYTLTEGITCGDGTPLTASTVADNFRFVADPANQSPQLGVFGLDGDAGWHEDFSRGNVSFTSCKQAFAQSRLGIVLWAKSASGDSTQTPGPRRHGSASPWLATAIC